MASTRKKIRFTVPNGRMAACAGVAISEYNVESVSFVFNKREEVEITYVSDAETDKLIRQKMLEFFRMMQRAEE